MAINQLLDAPGTRQSIRARKIALRSRYLILILCILAATTLFRTIHLDADPVPWFTEEVGYQIDEGYKTLSPRNLFLYGDIHWNQADQYRGWMTASAITQWPYYWAFELLGPELSSARMVSILYAVVFLMLAAVFLWKRVSPGLAVTGVLLLASDPALFLFSRSALFETSLALFLYAGLFLAVMLPLRYQRFSVVPVICMSIPAMFFIKLTAIVYMAPVILCLALVSLREHTGRLLNIRIYMIALPILLVSDKCHPVPESEWMAFHFQFFRRRVPASKYVFQPHTHIVATRINHGIYCIAGTSDQAAHGYYGRWLPAVPGVSGSVGADLVFILHL